MIDVRTAPIGDPKTLRERTAGTMTVLVMRKWPRGTKREWIDFWIPQAGPSLLLLKNYQSDGTHWDRFAAYYQIEQYMQEGCTMIAHFPACGEIAQAKAESPHNPVALIRRIAEGKGPLTLLCHEDGEEDTVLCHRRLLAVMVREALAPKAVKPTEQRAKYRVRVAAEIAPELLASILTWAVVQTPYLPYCYVAYLIPTEAETVRGLPGVEEVIPMPTYGLA